MLRVTLVLQISQRGGGVRSWRTQSSIISAPKWCTGSTISVYNHSNENIFNFITWNHDVRVQRLDAIDINKHPTFMTLTVYILKLQPFKCGFWDLSCEASPFFSHSHVNERRRIAAKIKVIGLNISNTSKHFSTKSDEKLYLCTIYYSFAKYGGQFCFSGL